MKWRVHVIENGKPAEFTVDDDGLYCREAVQAYVARFPHFSFVRADLLDGIPVNPEPIRSPGERYAQAVGQDFAVKAAVKQWRR